MRHPPCSWPAHCHYWTTWPTRLVSLQQTTTQHKQQTISNNHKCWKQHGQSKCWKNMKKDSGSNDSCSVYLETNHFVISFKSPHHNFISPGSAWWPCLLVRNGSNWSSARWRCDHGRAWIGRCCVAWKAWRRNFLRGKNWDDLSDAWNEPTTAPRTQWRFDFRLNFLAQYGSMFNHSLKLCFWKIRKRRLRKMKSEATNNFIVNVNSCFFLASWIGWNQFHTFSYTYCKSIPCLCSIQVHEVPKFRKNHLGTGQLVAGDFMGQYMRGLGDL